MLAMQKDRPTEIAKTIADAGLRIEINRRVLADKTVSFYGAWRRRGKERKYVGYVRWQEIPESRKRAYEHGNLVGNFAADSV